MLPVLTRTDETIDVVHVSDPEVTPRADLMVEGVMVDGVLVGVDSAHAERAREGGAALERVSVRLTAENAFLRPYMGWLQADTECDRVGTAATRLTLAPLNAPAAARADRSLRNKGAVGDSSAIDEAVYAWLRAGVVAVRGSYGLDRIEVVERLPFAELAIGLWQMLRELTNGTLETEAAPSADPKSGGDSAGA